MIYKIVTTAVLPLDDVFMNLLFFRRGTHLLAFNQLPRLSFSDYMSNLIINQHLLLHKNAFGFSTLALNFIKN